MLCGNHGGVPVPPKKENRVERSVPGFEYELAELLNRHSRENDSDTPSFILAIYLKNCLSAWNDAIAEREHWHGRTLSKERAIPGPLTR